jgi:hypothetical protein
MYSITKANPQAVSVTTMTTAPAGLMKMQKDANRTAAHHHFIDRLFRLRTLAAAAKAVMPAKKLSTSPQ